MAAGMAATVSIFRSRLWAGGRFPAWRIPEDARELEKLARDLVPSAHWAGQLDAPMPSIVSRRSTRQPAGFSGAGFVDPAASQSGDIQRRPVDFLAKEPAATDAASRIGAAPRGLTGLGVTGLPAELAPGPNALKVIPPSRRNACVAASANTDDAMQPRWAEVIRVRVAPRN